MFLWSLLCLKPVILVRTANEYINHMHDTSVSWPNAIGVFWNLQALIRIAAARNKKKTKLDGKVAYSRVEIQKHKQNDKINSINRSAMQRTAMGVQIAWNSRHKLHSLAVCV